MRFNALENYEREKTEKENAKAKEKKNKRILTHKNLFRRIEEKKHAKK